MSDNADRWKIDGDCSKCRRQPYCKKACRLNRKAFTDIITQAIYDKTGLGEIMSYLERSRQMKMIKEWIREMDPEDKKDLKDLIENIVAWGSLFGIAFMLSGICV